MTNDVTSAQAGPWPGPFGVELPSSWTLSGRQLTAWHTVTKDVIDRYVHPNLRPRPASSYASRVRFYTLEANGERFHEAAISLPIRAGDVDGEASLLLWSDSERYSAWARDGFGWSVVAAEFEYTGSLWHARSPEGGTGFARVRSGALGVSLLVADAVAPGAATGAWMTRLPWLAPRRVLHRAGLDGETREVLEVTPTMRRPGSRFTGRGRLNIQFGPDDPLSTPCELECDLEVIDDFEISVGDQLKTVALERLPGRVGR